ncbi:hypothetical protein N7537_001781 [Penicillium hordei]|uniref:Uncharacterized protein n=1 Tax=Penicillium hordei TaxID=40994 RepID=A0AAD6H8E3_9EURO|nr:uncharacterized protein N7537_001781 [Penicillium hordei]KAJ5616667.1 hypothetical protein N7537_001781 [Penicillium hordei]
MVRIEEGFYDNQCFALPSLFIEFYFLHREPGFVARDLCGSRIYSFSTTQISEIVYRDAPKDLNVSPLHYPWLNGKPADLDDIHFNETWTWSCMFRAVFLRTGQGVIFHLSGVGELRPTHQITVESPKR